MYLLYALTALPLAYVLLYWLVPKGNPLHEIVQLPVYLSKTLRVPVRRMVEEKHRYGSHHRQYLLFFRPEGKRPQRRQVVLYLHGGGWQFGRPEMFRANAKVFTDQGFHVFCISYRRLPFHRFEAIHEDMSRGLCRVLELMQENGLADRRICLGGMSAGGHLVAMLLYDRENLRRYGLDQQLFSGIFCCGAPLDLSQMRPSFTLRALAGRRHSQRFKRANPIEFLQADERIPLLAIHSTNDGLVQYPAGKVFVERLRQINPQGVYFHTIPQGIHLDAGTWVMEDNEIRQLILEWLFGLEDGLQ